MKTDKQKHSDHLMLRELDTVASCLCTGEQPDERIAVTVIRNVSPCVLLAKKGPVTQRDQDMAQRLSELLTDKTPDARTFVFPFLVEWSSKQLNSCVLNLELCVAKFRAYTKPAMSLYQAQHTLKTLHYEFPSSKAYEHELPSSYYWCNQLENLFELLLYDIQKKCEGNSLHFDRTQLLTPERFKRYRRRFSSLATCCLIVRSSKILEFLIRESNGTETASERVVRRTMRLFACELKQRLDDICRYAYDIGWLGIAAKRMFQDGVVPFKWVRSDWDISRMDGMAEHTKFEDLDPEIQLILYLHGSHDSHEFSDPWQCASIGTSKPTSFWAAHWISTYNQRFKARWVMRAWDQAQVGGSWIWPRSFHIPSGNVLTDITGAQIGIERVNELMMQAIEPFTQQRAVVQRLMFYKGPDLFMAETQTGRRKKLIVEAEQEQAPSVPHKRPSSSTDTRSKKRSAVQKIKDVGQVIVRSVGKEVHK